MGRKRILIVDDEEGIRSMLAMCLESYGYEVNTAGDGAAALQRMERTSYDLIVTDYEMPGINGLELICRVRAKHPRIPFIIISGHGSADQLPTGNGVNCLPKPFELSVFMETIRSMLNDLASTSILTTDD